MSADARPAIISPFWDGLTGGGLSIVLMGLALIAFGAMDVEVGPFRRRDWLVLAILVNTTHFMASYRLLYGSMDRVRRAPWASIGVPAILLFLFAWRIFGPRGDLVADGLFIANYLYLAVHYTGQAFGMVATQARLAGWKMSTSDRKAIRFGTYALLAIHWVIALEWLTQTSYRPLYEYAVPVIIVVAVVSFGVGVSTYYRAFRRGDPVTLRSFVPWLALYFWYPAWILVPGGPLWVQLSHALQYLTHPLRVEANRFVSRTGRDPVNHVLYVYLGLVAAGLFFMKGPNLATQMIGPGWYSEPGFRDIFGTWVAIIGIHHYFTDGAVWKLRDPTVRNELFEHTRLERAS
jgi:hypothetical protein